METLWHDLRFGLRMLVKSPGFTLVALLVLALGIGANTAIFSAVNVVLLRSLPFHDPDRLAVPVSTNLARGSDRVNVSYGDFLDWKKAQVFEHVAVFQTFTYDLTGGSEPERVQAAVSSSSYFAVMGAPPFLGRTILPEENKPGGTRVAVLSYGLWQRRFGANRDLIGQTIKLNGGIFTVVGVMPPDSQYPDSVELWVPMAISEDNPPQDLVRRDNFIWQAVARLKPGVSLEQTQAQLRTIAQRIEQDNPVIRKGWSTGLIPLHEWIVGPQLRRALLVLLAAVGFVLLIGCVNVANLLLARAAGREREIAIRIALGAGRGRVVRQLLTESLLLALFGGAAGLLLAKWGIRALIAVAPDGVPRLNEAAIDGKMLSFTVALSLLTALIFGIIPALQATKTNLNESLKEGGRGAAGSARGRRVRGVLVVTEVALSLVLLVGAGLMVKSFLRLQQVDPGFKVDHLLTLDVNAPRARYREDPQVLAFYQGLTERLKAVPGVQSACVSSALPLGGGGFYLGRVFLSEGQPEPPAGPDHQAQWNVISPDYFTTMGMSLLKGRAFTERDTAEGTPVVVINETLAQHMFPNENPLGKRIRSWRDENLLREIVGVVQDVRYYGRDDQLRGLVYIPHTQNVWRSMGMTIRTTSDPASMASAIRSAVWSVDKDLAVANVKTMERILTESVARQRFSMLLLAIFAVAALVLAAAGIYGIMSYAVAQRTHEIGVRMALGAQASDVLRLVVKQGMMLALLGVVIGLGVAFAVTRLMSTLLYEVHATDPATFTLIALLLAAVALLACYLPARKATKVDPMVALRYE